MGRKKSKDHGENSQHRLPSPSILVRAFRQEYPCPGLLQNKLCPTPLCTPLKYRLHRVITFKNVRSSSVSVLEMSICPFAPFSGDEFRTKSEKQTSPQIQTLREMRENAPGENLGGNKSDSENSVRSQVIISVRRFSSYTYNIPLSPPSLPG